MLMHLTVMHEGMGDTNRNVGEFEIYLEALSIYISPNLKGFFFCYSLQA